MPSRPAWSLHHLEGPTASLLGLPGVVERAVTRQIRVLHPVDAAVVLGRAQPASLVDGSAAARQDLSVVRRTSGGGAVMVEPAGVLWVDVVVPAGDPLWVADAGRATWWLGRCWARALASCGAGPVEVHTGGLLRRPWSDLVCFAGLGPGEVSVSTTAHGGGPVAGGKVVGIAQRRTRQAVLLQSAALLRWEPGRLLSVLELSPEDRHRATTDLRAAGVPCPVPAAALLGALVTALEVMTGPVRPAH